MFAAYLEILDYFRHFSTLKSKTSVAKINFLESHLSLMYLRITAEFFDFLQPSGIAQCPLTMYILWLIQIESRVFLHHLTFVHFGYAIVSHLSRTALDLQSLL